MPDLAATGVYRNVSDVSEIIFAMREDDAEGDARRRRFGQDIFTPTDT